MQQLIDILHEGGYSCVIRGGGLSGGEGLGGDIRTFTGRGVSDLYLLLKNEPDFLEGASIADKVVGKGAAALMVLGRIARLHTDVISSPALAMLRAAGIAVTFAEEVPQIRNRDNTGFCPVESLCLDEDSAQSILPMIDEFIKTHMPEIFKP